MKGRAVRRRYFCEGGERRGFGRRRRCCCSSRGSFEGSEIKLGVPVSLSLSGQCIAAEGLSLRAEGEGSFIRSDGFLTRNRKIKEEEENEKKKRRRSRGPRLRPLPTSKCFIGGGFVNNPRRAPSAFRF